MLLVQDPKNCLVANDSSKPSALWWRSFEYVAIKNENDEFERINGFISCLKCYRALYYESASGTKHLVENADRCFPLTSTDHSADVAHGHKLIKYKLNQVGIRKHVKLSLKEKMN